MYAFIKGQLVSQESEAVVIENQGLGYRLQCAPALVPRFGAIGQTVCAYTSLVVRENLWALYAFPSQAECRLFELLQTVSGVGPKLASLVLGAFSPDQFALAILAADSKALTAVKGLGKKGAERLILELKDKLKSPELAAQLAADGATGAQSQAAGVGKGMYDDCLSAMLVLGYPAAAAKAMVDQSFLATNSLEENIRAALLQAPLR